MPFDITQLGMQAAQDATGSIMGMIAGGINDKRQLKQQGKLQDLQITGSKQMMDYQMMKELEMWKNTGYGAQKEMMKEAGINPALLYGIGGGGGQSVGSATASVSGGNAPSGGGEIMDMISQTTQRQMMEAQRKNIEADTKLKEADAAKTSGVDTEETKSKIANLAQETTNKMAQGHLMAAEQKLKDMEVEAGEKGMANRLELIEWNYKRAIMDYEKAEYELQITKETQDAVIGEMKARAIGAGLENELKQAGITKTKQEIAQMAQELEIKLRTVSVQEKTQVVNEFVQKAGLVTGAAGKFANFIGTILGRK